MGLQRRLCGRDHRLGSAPPPHQRTFAALAQVCRWEPALLTAKQRGQLNQAEKKLRRHGASPADILDFGHWWETHDWRGKRGVPPLTCIALRRSATRCRWPHQVRQEWGRFAHWRRERDATANGDLTAQILANQAQFQARRGQTPPPDPDLAEAIALWDEVKQELVTPPSGRSGASLPSPPKGRDLRASAQSC